jgi:hypothetical protein
MTPEQRRQAIDFGKIRGTGMPIPTGHLPVSARAHILNLYFELPAPVQVIFWRNRNLVGGTWKSKSSPSSTWKAKLSPSTSWKGKTPPPDSGTQTI